MRQGSFMYCEQKEHLCIFCNTAFKQLSGPRYTSPCKYVSYTQEVALPSVDYLKKKKNGIFVPVLIVFF